MSELRPDDGAKRRLDRHLAKEEAITGSPLTTGNLVRLLQDGPATYDAMLTAIMQAEDHINLETYILDDDAVGQRFSEALITKQHEGVQVNVIHDSVGTIGTPAGFFERLKESGIRVLEFNPVNPMRVRRTWNLNQRDHRKLLIVDGRVAFMGGINISSVHSGGSSRRGASPHAPDEPSWRDTDLRLEGPVVAELQKRFLATWKAQHGGSLAARNYFPHAQTTGQQVVRVIASSPDEPHSPMYSTLLSAIGMAQNTVHLTSAYFVPDPQLLAVLKAAVDRGVRVCLILPGLTDAWLVFHAGRRHYEALLKAGVQIYERQGVILHSKTALVDDVWAAVGSTNLDWRSFVHNHELDAVVLGSDFGNEVQAMFEKDLAQSRRITLEDWRRRALHLRVKEFLAHLWGYWL